MQRTETLITRPLAAEHEDDVPRSEIILDGVPSGVVISGALLEAAVKCERGYLVFMTDDIPYEDVLSVHLLDGDLQLLDTAQIGAPYSTGSFSALALYGENEATFRFIGDTEWRIYVLPNAKRVLPLCLSPSGVKRPFQFTRHFEVFGTPQPNSRH